MTVKRIVENLPAHVVYGAPGWQEVIPADCCIDGDRFADPAEAAIGLREAEARLDALFTLTARLARLTLAERL